MKKLIINADDFGLTKSCTDAILESFEKKIITNTTAVVNCDYFNYAANEAKRNDISTFVGVHFNLTEGIPLTSLIRNNDFFCNNGLFHGKINRKIPINSTVRQQAYDELCAQAERFISRFGTLIHADSHHHMHTAPFLAPVFCEVLKKYNIKAVRLHRNIGAIPMYKLLFKKSFNRRLKAKGFITTDYFGSLEDIISGIPDGITEIMVHPDFNRDGLLIDRQHNLAETIDPLLKRLEQSGITYISYKDLLNK